MFLYLTFPQHFSWFKNRNCENRFADNSKRSPRRTSATRMFYRLFLTHAGTPEDKKLQMTDPLNFRVCPCDKTRNGNSPASNHHQCLINSAQRGRFALVSRFESNLFGYLPSVTVSWCSESKTPGRPARIPDYLKATCRNNRKINIAPFFTISVAWTDRSNLQKWRGRGRAQSERRQKFTISYRQNICVTCVLLLVCGNVTFGDAWR